VQEEGAIPLRSSSIIVRLAEICVHVSVDFGLVPLTWAMVTVLRAGWNS
jgi:hypothetical protein